MIVVRRALPWLVLASGLVACNNQRPPDPPPRFEQPNSVDFVCVKDDVVTALDVCAGDDDENDGIALHALVTQHSRGEVAAIDMQAYKVLDSRREIPGYTFVPVGELPVAVVVPPRHPELTYVADFGSRDVRVLRTQGLVTPAIGSPDVQTVTLMASADADAVPAAPTHMELAPDEDALIVTAPDQGRVLWLPIMRCPNAEGAPETTDCEEYGQIDTANIVSIDLSASVDRIAPPPAPAAGEQLRYEKLCGFEEAAPASAPPITVSDDMLAAAPRPSGIAIDAFCIGDQPCTRRILVSDEALPLIHAIDIDAIAPGPDGGAALLAPIVVGVATKAVTVTPRVPVAVGNDEETQYVYAIDATDGSVLVTENGRVINVNSAPNVRPDRIALGDWQDLGATPAAVALTVMHPLFQLDAPAGQYVANATYTGEKPADADFSCKDDENHTEEDPARLRGVFLAIATVDGSVRIVDVHDMELLDQPDREDETLTSCRACPTEVRAPILIRNRERLARNFVTEEGEEPLSLTPVPTAFAFVVDNLAFNLRPDGTSGSADAPSLDCIACDSGQSLVFPPPSEDEADGTLEDVDGGTDVGQDVCTGETPALLCANDDPWTTSEETWSVRYEAVIPGANGTNAMFVAPGDAGNRTGSPEVTAPLDFCAAGVLGDDSIAAAYAGDSCSDNADPPTGDQIAITSAFLGEARLSALLKAEGELTDDQSNATAKACADATQAIKDDLTLAPEFAIRRAYRDRLVIEERLLRPVGPLRTYSDVQRCLGDVPMTYVVRTRDSFLVAGRLSGFAPQVVAGADDRCVVDSGADRLNRGRARLGCTFRNHAFTIRLRKPALDDAVQEPPTDLSLQIRTQSEAIKLLCDVANLGFGAASVVPVQLRYSDVDRHLYLVDIQDRGLVPIALDPFPGTIDSGLTFD